MTTITDQHPTPHTVADHIGIVLVSIFAITLPYEMQYSSIALLLLTPFIIYSFFKDRRNKIPRQFWLFQIVYWMAISGYLYSDDTFRANYMLERQLSILLFPVLIPYAIRLSQKSLEYILTAFIASCTIAIIFLSYHALHYLYVSNQPLKFLLSDDYLNQRFALPLNIHAGYLSMYVSLSVFFIFRQFGRLKKPLAGILLLPVLAILFAGLLLLASRNIIISTFIILLFIYPLFSIRYKLVYFLTSSILVLALVISVSRSAYFKERFSTEFFQDLKIHKVKLKDEYQVEPRMQRWICAVKLIEQRPWFGYGTGDEVSLLKEEYFKNDLMVSYRLEFNAHNQYLSTLIKHGIAGLIVFLAGFGYYLWLAIRNKDFLYTSFILLLLVGFLTENILDMNKGIFFFALFNTIFGYHILYVQQARVSREIS